MLVTKSFFDAALLIETPSFGDHRGSFTVSWERHAAASIGLPTAFVQDNHSTSAATHTLRGIHLQLPPHAQGKLVRVVRGRVLDVLVDLRPGSPTRGLAETIELAAPSVAPTGEPVEPVEQLWIPAGFGHGFCTLAPDTEVFYKVDAPYRPDTERTLAWNDPSIAIDWPPSMTDPVLSAKDTEGDDLATILAAVDAADEKAR